MFKKHLEYPFYGLWKERDQRILERLPLSG